MSNVVIVDDTDPRIIYDGDWSAASESSGAFQETLHLTQNASARAIFAFNGTSVQVFGVTPSSILSVSIYTLDGSIPVTITATNVTSPLLKKQLYASPPLQANFTHTLTIQPALDGVDFFLDFIQYTPASLSNSSAITPTSSQSVGDPVVKTMTPIALPSTTIPVNVLSSPNSSNIPSGIVALAFLGGVAVLLLVVGLLAFLRWRNRRKPKLRLVQRNDSTRSIKSFIYPRPSNMPSLRSEEGITTSRPEPRTNVTVPAPVVTAHTPSRPSRDRVPAVPPSELRTDRGGIPGSGKNRDRQRTSGTGVGENRTRRAGTRDLNHNRRPLVAPPPLPVRHQDGGVSLDYGKPVELPPAYGDQRSAPPRIANR